MFTYAWDGKPLPAEDGLLLRVYIPDRYGMKRQLLLDARREFGIVHRITRQKRYSRLRISTGISTPPPFIYGK